MKPDFGPQCEASSLHFDLDTPDSPHMPHTQARHGVPGVFSTALSLPGVYSQIYGKKNEMLVNFSGKKDHGMTKP